MPQLPIFFTALSLRSCLLRVAVPLLLAGVLSACGEKTAPPPATAPAMPVTVIRAEPQSLPATLDIVAQTEGAKETEVRARVGGILEKNLYVEGSEVKAGQPLFQIDPVPYELNYAEAKARAEQAAREENRLKGLAAKQAVSQKEYDDAKTTNNVAQSALKQAKLNLEWTTVRAPVSGHTGRATKSVGSLVSVGTESLLTSIYQSNPIWVRFGLSENEASKLQGGRPSPESIMGVELLLPNGKLYDGKGKINFLASTIDTVLGTQQLRAEFENPQNALLPGQFVRVRLITAKREGIFLVPQVAVLRTDKGFLVMTVDKDSKVAPRPVQTAEWVGKDWVITSGLQAGDQVIVDNLIKLRPGNPVTPKAPDAQKAAGMAAPSADPKK